jgi:hypothetical protein
MKSNTPIDYKNAKLILVPEKVAAHFLEYDFYQRNGIQQPWNWAVCNNTRTHACDSKHTLDILFIELLKTFCSTLFLFYKKAYNSTNHEFLADEKVVNSYNNVPFYQSLLLSKKQTNPTYLASNLNYLITKNDYSWWQNHIKKEENTLPRSSSLPTGVQR